MRYIEKELKFTKINYTEIPKSGNEVKWKKKRKKLMKWNA